MVSFQGIQIPPRQSKNNPGLSPAPKDKKLPETIQAQNERPAKRQSVGSKASRLNPDHGSLTMKVYPVTEASMNTLKTNSKNSSLQYSLVSAFSSIVVSVDVGWFFSTNPTPTMNALAIVATVVGPLAALVQFLSARRSIKTANDEWQRIEKNTKFQEISLNDH